MVRKKVSDEYNLLVVYPEIASEWDYKNNELGPEKFTPYSNKKAYWICNNCSESWFTFISGRTKEKSGCPYCSGRFATKTNNLLVKYPEIASEWDYKNNELGPEAFTPNSNKKAHWICSKCNNVWETMINIRTGTNKSGCPYCNNIYPTKDNNLLVKYPEIASEWDYKNNELGPEAFLPNSRKNAYWVCNELGHFWKARIESRLRNGCPYCKLTPRSRDEIYLLFELKKFFDVSEEDHKVQLDKVYDVDIKLKKEKVIIEYDGAYWHKDRAEKDLVKTKKLTQAGWTVIRVREKPLKIVSRKYNIRTEPMSYKKTADKTLDKLNELGFKVKGLKQYKENTELINKKLADKYISKLLRQKDT
jgi:rubrerythrin